MTQQEIQFFWPLTEQLTLDLDFSPSIAYENQKMQSVSLSGAYTLTVSAIEQTTFQFRPEIATGVGYWSIPPAIQVWRAERPNWLHQKMTKVFFGWEWKDK